MTLGDLTSAPNVRDSDVCREWTRLSFYACAYIEFHCAEHFGFGGIMTLATPSVAPDVDGPPTETN